MTTVKQIMEAFPDSYILLINDTTESQISGGTMPSREMIRILSEEILGCKVNRCAAEMHGHVIFIAIHLCFVRLCFRNKEES